MLSDRVTSMLEFSAHEPSRTELDQEGWSVARSPFFLSNSSILRVVSVLKHGKFHSH